MICILILSVIALLTWAERRLSGRHWHYSRHEIVVQHPEPQEGGDSVQRAA